MALEFPVHAGYFFGRMRVAYLDLDQNKPHHVFVMG
jgi:hypothetical protein